MLSKKLHERYIKGTVHHAGFYVWASVDKVAEAWKQSGQTCTFSEFLCEHAPEYSDIPTLEEFEKTIYKNPRFAIENTFGPEELRDWCSDNGLDYETCRRLQENVELRRSRGYTW